jgi:uncharacterized protein
MKVELLVLWLTIRCQLRCRYCYLGSARQDETAAGADMTMETVERVLGLIEPSELQTLQLAGGEPTLNRDVLRQTVQLARRLGITRIALQSNGCDWDDALIAFCMKHQIGVGLSIDGLPDVHDRQRGRGAETWNLLRRCEEAGLSVGITVVPTNDSVGELPILGAALSGFSCVRSLGIDLPRLAGHAQASDLPEASALRAAVNDLRMLLTWSNLRRPNPLTLREAGAGLAGARQPYCPAEAGRALVVAPDGRLAPCGSLLVDPVFGCGHLDRSDCIDVSRQLPRASCGDCGLRDRCRGRCPSRAILNPDEGRLDCVIRHAAMREAAGVN